MNDQPDAIKPTRQRMRRAPGFDELTETQSGGVARKSGAVRVWSQLENLYRNRRLTDEQYQAGQKYFADWYLAGFSPRVTSRMSEWVQGAAGSPGNLDAAERRVFHAKRFAQANVILEDMGTRKVVHWLVITDTPAETIGRKYWGYSGKHSAAAGAVTGISISLQRLAKFYGLVK
jgi:hypothetical protein